MVRGSSLSPSLEPGGHPQISRISPNLNILRPLLGPDGVARPSHRLREGMGTPGRVCPSRHRSFRPPAFCPSIAGPQRCIRGDFGVDELRPRENTGLPLPPLSHSVPNPEPLSPSGRGRSSCRTRWFELMLLQDPSLFQPCRDAEISAHPPHPRDSKDTLGLPALHAWLARYPRRHFVPAGSESGWSCTLGQLQAAKLEGCSALEI